MNRGRLRIYLGTAAGVGKTYAMLGEASRRRARGQDVVVGLVETHGRVETQAELRSLEVVPRRCLPQGGTTLEEMDVEAILARRPAIALVDDLAHTNLAGSRNHKRWQDVDELLRAGIDVISTMNIQHLESLNDVVQRITGVPQHETVPDAFVRRADELQLVEMAPEALRRRLAHGDIYPADKIDAASANLFRPGNLAALRELALLWLADRVDESLHGHLAAQGVQQPWETRERVMVALTSAPGADAVVRRASRMATRAKSDLLAVHVRQHDGLRADDTARLAAQRRLVDQLGGAYREVAGDDVAEALLQVARAEQVTQLVLGASRRTRWSELLHGSAVNRVLRDSGPIDVHVISPPSPAEHARLPRRPRLLAIPMRRRLWGAAVGAAGLPALTWVLLQAGDGVDLATALLSFLALTVLVATTGGIWPGLVVAVLGFAAANWFFTSPLRTWTVHQAQDLLALGVFLTTALVISALSDLVARRAAEAARARAESAALARLAATATQGDDPLARLVTDLRHTLDLEAVALLTRADGGWTVEASAGGPCPLAPDHGSDTLRVNEDSVLVLRGPRTLADDRRILAAFAAQLALAVRQRGLQAKAARAQSLAEGNRLRTALLSAVSHDLRTPLATIKAWLTGLLEDDVEFDRQTVLEMLRASVAEVDRLDTLVGNLLDMSRLQTGAVQVTTTAVPLDGIAAAVLGGLPQGSAIRNEVPDDIPPVLADPALLERIVANLVDNAVRHSPPGVPVHLRASTLGNIAELRIVDHGPGILPDDRERIFQPFQRLGDQPRGSGVGLGLAVARGLAEAISAELTIEDTPAGGTTMLLRLKLAT